MVGGAADAQASEAPAAKVTFGPVFVLDRSREAVTIATNRGAAPASFNVTATWSDGGRIVATGSGSDLDLPPGASRIEQLDLSARPTVGSAVGVATADVRLGSVSAADADAKIGFGEASFEGSGRAGRVVIPVTNHDARAHELFVVASIARKSAITGVATGPAIDVGPGQSRSAALTVTGDASASETVTPYAVVMP